MLHVYTFTRHNLNSIDAMSDRYVAFTILKSQDAASVIEEIRRTGVLQAAVH